MSKYLENQFKFWCPIEKSQETIFDPETGQEVWRLGGIASTSDEDSDGEFLNPKGFDIKPFITSGVVNWHHQAKGQPATIIGEPTKAELRPEGLYIETDLYPSSKIAQDVWELAQTLERDSKTRRLGYSIEGKVVKRKSNDKKSPDYKKIEKAIITGVAITHQPKNPKTFASIIKGEVDSDFDDEYENDTEEKSMNTENAAALKKESVDKKIKVQTFSKSQVLERLFKDIPAISIEKAEKINLLITKLANMKGRKNVTDEDISKAYESLGLEEAEEVQKGEAPEEAATEEEVNKAENSEKEEEGKTENDESENEEEEEKKPVEKAEGDSRFDRIEKAIVTSHQMNAKYIKALGVMVKDASQKLEAAAVRETELIDLVKAQDETISVLSEKIEAFGSEVPGPKAISSARTIERSFEKANDDTLGGSNQNARKANVISMSKQKSAVAEILDQATFAKGYDEEFSKAVTSFEANKTLPSTIIARIKNEFGYEIVK